MPIDDGRIDELLRVLDHPVPAVTAQEIAGRAARGPSRVRWAAAVLLTAGIAGAAFALPASPLRSWVAGVMKGWSEEGPKATAPARPQEPRREGAGIAVAPGNALVIQFDGAAAGEARIVIADRADILVRAGAGRAAFTSEVSRLLIDTHGLADTFAIEIPRDAPRVEVRVHGSRVFLKEGDRLTAGRPAGGDGAYRVPLGRSPS